MRLSLERTGSIFQFFPLLREISHLYGGFFIFCLYYISDEEPFPVFHELFNLPRNNTEYSFNYRNSHIVALSSGHAKGVEEAGKSNWRYAKGSFELYWLKKGIEKASKNEDIEWKVVYMHHPLNSYGGSHVQGWQEQITPLLDKYKVDLVLAGHRHVYECYSTIRNNNEIIDQGTVYITNGSAGGSLQGLGGDNLDSIIYTSPEKEYNYAIMTIEGNEQLF